MAKQLRDRLQGLVGNVTGVVSWIGLGTLLAISLAIPSDLSLKSLPSYLEQLPNLPDAIQGLSNKIPAIFLAFTTVFWYQQYKSAVAKELDLVDGIFSDKNKPTYFGNLIGHRGIPLLGYVLVVTYAVLILSVTRIEIFCIVALVLHASDLIGNGLVLQNVNRAVARFKVVEDSDAQFVRDRREIIMAYYFDNPTIPRICVTTILTAIALVVAVHSSGSSPYRYSAYALMIINILLSEAVIKFWRARRDKALDDIAKREEDNAISTHAPVPVTV
jgi:hypothetical protein